MLEERLKLIWKQTHGAPNVDSNMIKIELNLSPTFNVIYPI
jgi:hypothetical protein